MSEKAHLLIIDDEKNYLLVLQTLLEDEGYAVTAISDPETALAFLDESEVDVVVTDMKMPKVTGREVLERVKKNWPYIPVLIMTAFGSIESAVEVMKYGAFDYITKPFSLNELTARVAAHLRRDERNKGRTAVLTSNNLIVNLSERAVFYGDTVVPFSKREFDIIEFLMTNANQVFDKERIYEAVWGYDAEGDSNVIKEHIRKIRGKLNEITGQDYIETIWGVGYKWKRL